MAAKRNPQVHKGELRELEGRAKRTRSRAWEKQIRREGQRQVARELSDQDAAEQVDAAGRRVVTQRQLVRALKRIVSAADEIASRHNTIVPRSWAMEASKRRRVEKGIQAGTLGYFDLSNSNMQWAQEEDEAQHIDSQARYNRRIDRTKGYSALVRSGVVYPRHWPRFVARSVGIVDLTNSSFAGVTGLLTFEDCDLRGCDFSDFYGMLTFHNCDVSGCNFRKAAVRIEATESDLSDCVFDDAAIDLVVERGPVLAQGSTWRNAKAYLTSTTIMDSLDARQSSFRNATVTVTGAVNFQECDFTNATLDSAYLTVKAVHRKGFEETAEAFDTRVEKETTRMHKRSPSELIDWGGAVIDGLNIKIIFQNMDMRQVASARGVHAGRTVPHYAPVAADVCSADAHTVLLPNSQALCIYGRMAQRRQANLLEYPGTEGTFVHVVTLGSIYEELDEPGTQPRMNAELRQWLGTLIALKGEVCASSWSPKQSSELFLTGGTHGDHVGFVFRGHCSARFPADAWSERMPSGLRYSEKIEEGTHAHDEVWVSPAQSELVAIVMTPPSRYSRGWRLHNMLRQAIKHEAARRHIPFFEVPLHKKGKRLGEQHFHYDAPQYLPEARWGRHVEAAMRENPFPTARQFYLDDISYKEQDALAEAFARSYEKATGAAWSTELFFRRAENWTFFGVPSSDPDATGAVAVRVQRSGLVKLVGAGGNLRAVIAGSRLLKKVFEKAPVWGAVSEDLLEFAKRMGLSPVHEMPGGIRALRVIVSMLPPGVLGDATPTVNADGSLSVDIAEVGSARKFMVVSPSYLVAVAREFPMYTAMLMPLLRTWATG